MPPQFRHATLADAHRLAVFAERAFTETFANQNTRADMAAYCAGAFGEDIEAVHLADPARVCVLSERDGVLAAYAYVVVGSTSVDVVGEAQAEIQRFYVDQPWHGRGLAQQLMAQCIAEARARDRRTLWLGVWERNERAIRFYERCGFRTVGSQRFMLGADAQNDLVMSRSISE